MPSGCGPSSIGTLASCGTVAATRTSGAGAGIVRAGTTAGEGLVSGPAAAGATGGSGSGIGPVISGATAITGGLGSGSVGALSRTIGDAPDEAGAGLSAAGVGCEAANDCTASAIVLGAGVPPLPSLGAVAA